MTTFISRLLRPTAGALIALFLLPALLLAAEPATAPPPVESDGLPLGQLLLVAFAGADIDDHHPIIENIRERRLGGVLLLNYGPDRDNPANNIVSPQQLRSLTKRLQAAAPADRPLLIAVDQEGGRVCRLKQNLGFPPTVSSQELGRRNDPSYTYRKAYDIARTLRQAGVNLNLAPVVDLNANPENPVIGALQRSYSDNAAVVTAHARQFILAHHKAGILCSLKHFPGHGSSSADSHKGFVDVTTTWAPAELQPYRTLIAEDLADTVLTAHVFNARLDPQVPATLSRPIVDGLLRQQLGYDGVVISDDLSMTAISGHYSLEEATARALNAGVDILLLADSRPDTTRRMLAILHKLVASKRVSKERILQSLQRIDRLKKKLATTKRGVPCPNRQP